MIARPETHWALEPFLKLPLSYFLGGWPLMTLLLLSSGPAYGEWVAVEKNNPLPGLQTVYVDPDNIRSQGNLVMIWILIDFDKGVGPFGHGPHPFFPRRPASNSTARINAFSGWHTRSSQAIWEPA